MDVDLRGRVKNTHLSPAQCLLPLFEAIINAIHAVSGVSGAMIDVQIERVAAQGALTAEEPLTATPVESFIIRDNGMGFTERNYRAFETCDSTHKAAQGGRGIGRLLWLKAFDHAEVISYYVEGGKYWKRSFSFVLSEKGIEDHEKTAVAASPNSTTVRLCGFLPPFRDRCPKSSRKVAERIIEHFLEYFVLETCPTIRLLDSDGVTDLKSLFATEVREHAETSTFGIKEKDFRLTHLRLKPIPDTQHRMYFCAHQRAAISEPLSGKIPNLPAVLKDDAGRPFVYAGYLASNYLDEAVSPDRTRFYTSEEGVFDFADSVSWDEVVDGAVQQASSFLAPYTAPVGQHKHDVIREYVQNKAPQFRVLLKHKREAIDRIPPDLPVEKLGAELFKIDQEYQVELQEKYQEIVTVDPTRVLEFEEHRDQVEHFLEEWNEVGMSKLAQYVAHRKATLRFLEERLRLRQSGKYCLEEAIHEVIFPLRTTSDDIRAEQMNLWIIDEKLAYHYYLASDKRLSQMPEAIENESGTRPDLLVFNTRAAFVDSDPPFGSIVLVEFKRPAKDDYTDEENPIIQLYDYVRDIKAGKAKDRHSRPITIPEHNPFYAYAVCDITPKLRRQAENAQLTLTSDSHGYFGYNVTLGVYLEVVSFDKLMDDAKKRNAAFFDRLFGNE